jgi:hypothetical protein
MKKAKIALCSLVFLMGMLSFAGPVQANLDHCEAGFHACIEAADGGDEANDCVDGYLECIGYDG